MRRDGSRCATWLLRCMSIHFRSSSLIAVELFQVCSLLSWEGPPTSTPHDRELLVQGTELALRRRSGSFQPFFKVFEWLFKIYSSLSSWLILWPVLELSSFCSNSWSVSTNNSLRSSVCSWQSEALSFPLSWRFQTVLWMEAHTTWRLLRWSVESALCPLFKKWCRIDFSLSSGHWNAHLTFQHQPVPRWLLLPGC